MSKKEKKEKTVTGKFMLEWSTHSISYAINLVAIAYLTYYCTDGLGLNPALVGVILLICKLFDGVTDVFAAVIIERTNTKWGKARPYMLFLPLAWVLTIILFAAPPFGTVGETIFIFLMYFMINSVCTTLFAGAEPVYLARALKNPEDSSKVLSISGLCSGFGGLVFGILMPILIDNMAGQPGGWTKIIIIMAIPGLALSWIRFATIKERVDIDANYGVEQRKETSKFGFKDIIVVLKQNPHVFIIAIVQMIASLIQNSGGTVMTYYFQYIFGDLSAQSAASMMGLLAMLSISIFPKLFDKFGTRKVLMVAMIMGVFGSLLRFIPVLPVQMVSYFMSTLGGFPASMFFPALLIDCMDYHEWKTGSRVESVFGAVNSLANKLGTGLASVGVGFVMGLAGYDGTLAVQSETANAAIVGLYAVLPTVGFIIMVLAYKAYKIDSEMPKVRAELAERRKTASNHN